MTIEAKQVGLSTAANVVLLSPVGSVADLVVDTTSGVIVYLHGSSTGTSSDSFVLSTAHTQPITLRVFPGDEIWAGTAATSAIVSAIARY